MLHRPREITGKLDVALEWLSVYIVLICLEYTTHKCLDLNRSREWGDCYTCIFNIIKFLLKVCILTSRTTQGTLCLLSHSVRGKSHFPDQPTTHSDGNLWKACRVSVSHKETLSFTIIFIEAVCVPGQIHHIFLILASFLPLPPRHPSGWELSLEALLLSGCDLLHLLTGCKKQHSGCQITWGWSQKRTLNKNGADQLCFATGLSSTWSDPVGFEVC